MGVDQGRHLRHGYETELADYFFAHDCIGTCMYFDPYVMYFAVVFMVGFIPLPRVSKGANYIGRLWRGI